MIVTLVINLPGTMIAEGNMSYFDRVGGTGGIMSIVGSGFYWAWFDALFMGALFVRGDELGGMPEYGAIAAFSLSLPVFAFAFWRGDRAAYFVTRGRVSIVAALAGTAGSLLYLCAGISGGMWIFTGGALLCGLFAGTYGMSWGMIYCKNGARSATPLVAGAFALAPLFDAPLLFMMPEAKAAFFSFFPLASGILYAILLKRQLRERKQGGTTRSADDPDRCRDEAGTYGFRPLTTPISVGDRLGKAISSATEQKYHFAPSFKIRAFFETHLGVSLTLIGAVTLVMSGFGYLQHIVSFSSEINGTGVQVARGAAAIIMFALLMTKPQHSSTVYRVGFLAMVAGIMMLPFFFGTDSLLVSGAIILSGYTAFDIFIWVAFSHIAHMRSKSPVKTVSFIRFVVNATTALGLLLGTLTMSPNEQASSFAYQETIVVGYLIVIAIVVLLSSEESAALLRSMPPTPSAGLSIGAVGEASSERLAAWFELLGLTARERDVADLLLQGRSQPWIADALSISENTVGTHVRHIYQKADVHNRQQFFDLAISSLSPEMRETLDSLTRPT